MLDWLYEIVADVIIGLHSLLSLVFNEDSGWAWGGSIVLLTVCVRVLIFPLFVKQVRTSRKMQELQPEVQKLRKKYKNDRQRMNQEMMKLYQEHGANPLSGCLPLLLQMPIFFALFRVLNAISTAKPGESRYGISSDLIQSAQHAQIFVHGATIPSKFLTAWDKDQYAALIVTGIAVAISTVTTFLTIRSSVGRSLAQAQDTDNPMMNAQKMMVWFAPLFGLFGIGFPLGVLMYWVTSNTWSLVQTHYIHKKYPATNAPGGDPKQNGQAGKGGKDDGKPSGGGLLDKLKKKQPEPEPEPEPEPKPKAVRQQPSKQSRAKRKR